MDGLDRRTGQLSSHVALSARTGGMFLVAPLVSKGTKAMGIGLLALGLALISIGLLGPVLRVRLRTLTLRDALQATGAFLERGVPSATPDAAGAFRIVFGAFVLWFLHANQAQHFVVTGAEASSATGPYGLVVRWLAGHPGSLTVVDVVLWTCGALFLVGFATRLTYALLVAAFLTWVSAFTLRNSIHPISALSVTLVCLLPASWGDGLSVDAWLRRRQGAPAPVSGKRYGFAIWVPGFVFGLAFLAAAWAKAGVNGEWVFNGTVKYPVDGLPALAVAVPVSVTSRASTVAADAGSARDGRAGARPATADVHTGHRCPPVLLDVRHVFGDPSVRGERRRSRFNRRSRRRRTERWMGAARRLRDCGVRGRRPPAGHR